MTFLLIFISVAIFVVYKVRQWDKEENERHKAESIRINDRLNSIKNTPLSVLRQEDFQFLYNNNPSDAVEILIKAILEGNNNAIPILKLEEHKILYWIKPSLKLTSQLLIALCNKVLSSAPDTHWYRKLGDEYRKIGDAPNAMQAYKAGIAVSINKTYTNKWKWLNKAWKGELVSKHGKKLPPIDWKTVDLWHSTDIECCHFGLDVCIRYTKEKQHAEYLSRLESDGGYELVTSGIEYEQFIATIVKKAGFSLKMTPITDQGVDIVVCAKNSRVAVQCKFYKKSVSNSAVQEVFAGKSIYRCNHACVVSNAQFTSSAKKLAKANKVKLLHHGEVVDYLKTL